MSDFPLFPAQASTIAWQVDALYGGLVALTVIFCLLVFGMVCIFAIKYRRRSDDEQPKPNHGNLALELSWTIIPLFLGLFVFLLGADVFFRLQRAPADPLEIYVVGKQWMWKIQHESGKRLRGTVASFLLIGCVMTLVALHLVGRFGVPELIGAAALVPEIFVGFALSSRIAPIIDRGYTRIAVLTTSSAAALILLIRQF